MVIVGNIIILVRERIARQEHLQQKFKKVNHISKTKHDFEKRSLEENCDNGCDDDDDDDDRCWPGSGRRNAVVEVGRRLECWRQSEVRRGDDRGRVRDVVVRRPVLRRT